MLHNPILTIDCVIFHWTGTKLTVLLENRDREPFENEGALPGGFVHTNEDADLAGARDRILDEKIGFKPGYFEKVDSIGNNQRDPRGWAVSVIYLGILSMGHKDPVRRTKNRRYVDVAELLAGQHAVAFDHVEIVRLAYQRLSIRCGYSAIALWFLNETFTIRELMDVHTALMGFEPNKVSIHKRYVKSEVIQPEIDLVTNKPVKISSPAGPNATIYRHNLKEPVNFQGVLGLGQPAQSPAAI